MFRFDDSVQKQKIKEKMILQEIENKEKPKLKDLLAIIFAQYIILLPILILSILVFGFILWLMYTFWLT